MSKKRRKPPKKRHHPVPPPPFEVRGGGKSIPITHRHRVYECLVKRQYLPLCESILQVLGFFQKHNFTSLDKDGLSRINDFVNAVFTIMTDKSFTIPPHMALPFVGHAHLMANVTAISEYDTTDSALRHIALQPENLVKLMFLYTVKNVTRLNPKLFYDFNARLASLWYFTYPLPTIGCVFPHYQGNMRRHFEAIDERFEPSDHRTSLLYFYCTYFVGESRHDQQIKAHINKVCQQKLASVNAAVVNKPDRKSIAVVTSKWWPNTAVYKSCFPLIDRFRQQGYRMTLVHTGSNDISEMAKDYFDRVEVVKFQKKPDKSFELTTKEIMTNDFQLAYFTDIGMTDESVWLSNLRLAPIQVTGHGHPVSTFGGLIDYFVMGDETDKLEDLDKNYSETPIVLPGLGCTPVWPAYKRRNLSRDTDCVLANCVWGPDKYNYDAMRLLQEMANKSDKLHFNIFASRGVHRYNAFLPFQNEIRELLRDRATLQSRLEYMAYMEEAEYGDFAINSWPFGGYNTVIEALYLGKPVVTLEGDRFYNMAASALLRRVGLDNLITHSAPEFIDLCARMANDPDYLAEQKEKLAAVDLRKALFETDEPLYFERAMEYIIENHDAIQTAGRPVFAKELV